MAATLEQDIAERKHAEEKLRESEERHRSLVDFSPYGIAIHSMGKIVYMNIAGASILGSASPEQFIGKNVFEIRQSSSRLTLNTETQLIKSSVIHYLQ